MPPPGARFLLWLRELDLTRRPGWIGGVCAGIAERLGIDPLIVRGVFVVVAVLGGPALLAYAAAWLLLPDEDGVLPIEQALRRTFTRVHAGIGALVLASMLPAAQGFWSLGASPTATSAWVPVSGRVLWTGVVVAMLVAFVVWIARRAGRPDRAATPGAAPATGGPGRAGPPDAPAEAPSPGAPGGTQEDLAAWQQRQEEWRAEREAFRAQQSATARETARARAEESRLRAHAITAARLERRRVRRAENPRLRASATLAVLGAAAVAGALASLSASGSTAVVVGFAVAALVLGLAIVIAGLLRRRAVMLILASLIVLVTAATASLLPPDRRMMLIPGSYAMTSASTGRYGVLVGSLDVTITPDRSTPGGVLDLWQGAGNVSILLEEGAAVRLEATSADRDLQVVTPSADGDRFTAPSEARLVDGLWRWTETFGDPEADPFVVRIEQRSGSIYLYDQSAAAQESPDPPATTDTPTDLQTGAATAPGPDAGIGTSTTDTKETAR